MNKLKTSFVCQNCGYSSLRWQGKCPSCEQWDTLIEEIVKEASKGLSPTPTKSTVYSINDVDTISARRISIGIAEFDRLLGDGVMPGSVVLLGGEPGVGKSTLLIQVASALALKGNSVLYVSGEESLAQIKMRAQRIGLSGEGLLLLNETNVESIVDHIEKHKPQLVIIDSIQVLYLPDLSSAPGSVTQVRESAGYLTGIAKRKGMSLFLIGHVTKNGSIAGPRVVEHLVDTVLYFEGDTHNRYRILRTLKNRFGSTDEIGIFNMQSNGLHEVSNPSEIFLSMAEGKGSGSIVVAAIEGTRPILVELQALVSPTVFGMPERRTIGLDHRRLSVLLAVLEKRAGFKLQNQNVFVNVVGGIKLSEPVIDLGMILAIVSSFREISIPAETVALGEVGLGGEVRPVTYIKRRVNEALRLGFKKIIMPCKNLEQLKDLDKIKLVGVTNINEAIEALF